MSNTILTFWFLFQVCWHQLHMMSPFSQAVFTDYLQKDRLGEAFIKNFFLWKSLTRGGHFFLISNEGFTKLVVFCLNQCVLHCTAVYFSVVPSQFDCSVTAGCPWRVLCLTHCAQEYYAPHTVPKRMVPHTLCPVVPHTLCQRLFRLQQHYVAEK